jgi:cardiolipin synthase (CMP-forming)
LSLPNLITLARIILVPVVIWLILAGHSHTAFLVFLIAGLSDALDGFLAKRFHMETELGAYLDPLADKLLIACIFVTLGLQGHLPAWLVIAAVFRDVLIVTAVALSSILGHPVTIKPLVISKANTAAQILLAGLVLADEGYHLHLEAVRVVLAWLTGLLTLASLASYLRSWLIHMA